MEMGKHPNSYNKVYCASVCCSVWFLIPESWTQLLRWSLGTGTFWSSKTGSCYWSPDLNCQWRLLRQKAHFFFSWTNGSPMFFFPVAWHYQAVLERSIRGVAVISSGLSTNSAEDPARGMFGPCLRQFLSILWPAVNISTAATWIRDSQQ